MNDCPCPCVTWDLVQLLLNRSPFEVIFRFFRVLAQQGKEIPCHIKVNLAGSSFIEIIWEYNLQAKKKKKNYFHHMVIQQLWHSLWFSSSPQSRISFKVFASNLSTILYVIRAKLSLYPFKFFLNIPSF